MNPSALAVHYLEMSEQHGLTGLVSKLCLLLSLALAAQGRTPAASRLVPLVFAVLSLNAARLGLGSETWILVLPAVVLMAASLWAAAAPEGLLAPLPPRGHPWRWPLAATLVWAFWCPVFSGSSAFSALWKAVWNSPLGALPHQAILVALVVSLASHPNGPRLFTGGAALAGLLLGGLDVLLLGRWSGAVLLVLSCASAFALFRGAREKGLANDDVPPVDRKPTMKPKREEEKGGPGRVWKLK